MRVIIKRILIMIIVSGLINPQTKEQIKKAKEIISQSGITESQAKELAK